MHACQLYKWRHVMTDSGDKKSDEMRLQGSNPICRVARPRGIILKSFERVCLWDIALNSWPHHGRHVAIAHPTAIERPRRTMC